MTTQLPSGPNPAIRRRLSVTSVAYTPQIAYTTQDTAARQLHRPQPPLRTPMLKSHMTNKHKEKHTKSQPDDRKPPSGIRLQKLDSSRPSTPSLCQYTPLPDIPAPGRSTKNSTPTSKKDSEVKLLKTDEASVTPENVVAMSDVSIERLTISTREEGKQTKAKAYDSNSSSQATMETGSGNALKNNKYRKNIKTLHKTSDALRIKQKTIEPYIVADDGSWNLDIDNSCNLYKKEQIKIKTVEPGINLKGVDHSSQTKNLVINDYEHSSVEKTSTSSHFVIAKCVSSETKDSVTAQTESNQHSSKELPSRSPIDSGRDDVSTSVATNNNVAPTQKTADQLMMKRNDTKRTERSQVAVISTDEKTLTSKPKTDTKLQSKKISLALKLPNGKRVLKEFKISETLQVVVNQARSLTLFPDEVNVAVSTSSVPKIVFSDLNVKISDSGLRDRTLLHVHVKKSGRQ